VTAKKARELSATLGVPTELAAFTETTPTGTIARVPPTTINELSATQALDWLENLGGFPPPSEGPSRPKDKLFEEMFWQLAAVAALIIDPHDALADKRLAADLRSARQRAAYSGSENISLAVRRIPLVLAFVATLCDRATEAVAHTRPMDNVERSYLRHLFLGLHRAHADAFCASPQLVSGSREPNGTGVIWAKEAIRLANKAVPPRILSRDRNQRASPWHATAKQLLRTTAGLTNAAIAARLRDPRGGSRNKAR
jgi:hypothetical protein